MLRNVLPCLQSILKRIRDSGILLGLNNYIAFIAGILDDLEDGLEVDIAVAGNRECALADAFKEAPLVGAGFSYDIAAKIVNQPW